MKSLLKIQWLAIRVLALTLAVSCATSPEGRKQFIVASDAQMSQLGGQAYAQIKKETPAVNDQAHKNYLMCIVRPLLNAINESPDDWEVILFDSPQVNAFALPGKKIGVYKGLLGVAKNADQLAAVVGHEIGHVLAKHSNERVSRAMVTEGGLAALDLILANKKGGQNQTLMAALGVGLQVGMELPNSRSQESEADVIGLKIMSRAGFNPEQSVDLWKNMEKASGGKAPPEFLSTHPAPSSRIKNLESHMGEAKSIYNSTPQRPLCQQ